MTAPTDLTDESLFSAFKLSPGVKCCIVIPVKNEEKYIVKTLEAFSAQVDVSGVPIDSGQFEILLLANNCSDHTVAHIENFQQNHAHLNIFLEEVTLPPALANIGYVRRLLMETAYLRLRKNGGGIIMTTDGDTTVAPDWIAQTQNEIRKGADAVGGRILLDAQELANLDECTRLLYLKDEIYHILVSEVEAIILPAPHDPFPRHHQHFNGSFAVTTECYAKSGGIPDVPHLEDCAFFERLQRTDSKVRHSNNVIVHTSARFVGRSEVGLSYQLNIWKDIGANGTDFRVESCASIVRRLTIKRKLMQLWKSRTQLDGDIFEEIRKITGGISIDGTAADTFKKSIYFGEWYAQFISVYGSEWTDRYPTVSVDQAILELKRTIANYSSAHLSQTSMR